MRLVFDDRLNRLSVQGPDGRTRFACEARNRTVRPGQFFHFGPCPRGTFRLGRPVKTRLPAFGRWFVPVLDLAPGRGPMARFRRAGIGIHGGGSGLLAPFAWLQGWRSTHGCIRLQNGDLERLIGLMMDAAARHEPLRLTVSGPAG